MNIGRCWRAFSARSDRAQADDRQRAGGAATRRCRTRARRPGSSASAHRVARRSATPASRARAACGWRRRSRSGGWAAKWVAASSIISPAPTNSTFVSRSRLEQLRGEAHRGRRHADRVRADLGRACALPGDRERALEHLLQRRCRACRAVRLAHRFLHLAEDLRLAEHHRAEPRLRPGNAWRAADGAFEHVGVERSVWLRAPPPTPASPAVPARPVFASAPT